MLTAKEQADILRIVRRMMWSQRVDLERKYKDNQQLTKYQWDIRRNKDRKILIDALKEAG